MANVDNPHGATLAGCLLRAREYVKGTNAAIYPGDFVQMGADGKVVVHTAGNVQLLGISLGYYAAAATSVIVADHQSQEYYIQDDGAGGTLAATDVGSNIDVLATAGNSTLLKSQQEADTNTVTSVAASLRIKGKHPADSWADNVRILVQIAEHHFSKEAAV
jgi:hypothetical protein